MKLTSKAFEHEGYIPKQYTCDGIGMNPPLTISETPSKTASLVLIMDDPDVPTSIRQDGMWDHWIIFNLPASTTQILEGKEPVGTHGMGTSRDIEYYAPCPPDGEHRYFFKLYALDTRLDLPAGSTKKQVLEAMKEHILATAVLIGRYKKESVKA